jgi:hypothetical protein
MESQDKASSLDIFYFRSIDLAGTHIKKKKKKKRRLIFVS